MSGSDILYVWMLLSRWVVIVRRFCLWGVVTWMNIEARNDSTELF